MGLPAGLLEQSSMRVLNGCASKRRGMVHRRGLHHQTDMYFMLRGCHRQPRQLLSVNFFKLSYCEYKEMDFPGWIKCKIL